MLWAPNRKRDRWIGEKAEEEFKRLIEAYVGFEVFLTQKNHSLAGRKGSYRIGKYTAGDADILYKIANPKVYHCEIKKKYPDSYGHYGIELYRLSNFISLHKMFGIPVYYVIYNSHAKKWIYRNFIELWNELKKGFTLFIDYRKKYSNQIFNISDKVFKKIIDNQKKNCIFLNSNEIMNFCTPSFRNHEINGKIRLYDESWYLGNKKWKATVVYFEQNLFYPLPRIIEEIKKNIIEDQKFIASFSKSIDH